MPRDFPEVFAILRDGVRNPCLQILRSHPCLYNRRRNSIPGGYHEVSNFMNASLYDGLIVRSPYTVSRDETVYIFNYFHSQSGEPQEVYYWFTPFALESRNGDLIPLLEFQYRSWIPTGYQPVPVRANMNQLFDTLTQIQDERLAEIRNIEDTHSIVTLSPRHTDFPSYENDITRWAHLQGRYPPVRHHSRPQTPPLPQIVETVRIVEVPVERLVVEHRMMPLPKAVGELLLSHARKGVDTCPITATPFAECAKLCVSSCFHIFDAESLARWQETHTSCPVCRSKIENIVLEESCNGVSAV